MYHKLIISCILKFRKYKNKGFGQETICDLIFISKAIYGSSCCLQSAKKKAGQESRS